MGVPRDQCMDHFREAEKWKKLKEPWRGWIRGSPIDYSERKAGPFPEDGALVEKAIKQAAKQKKRESQELSKRVYGWEYEHPHRIERAKAKERAEKRAKAKKAKKPQRTPAGKKLAAKSQLTATERLKVLAAGKKGHDGQPPAGFTEKGVAWAQQQKARKSSNFGLLLDGEIGLKIHKGKIKVTS